MTRWLRFADAGSVAIVHLFSSCDVAFFQKSKQAVDLAENRVCEVPVRWGWDARKLSAVGGDE